MKTIISLSSHNELYVIDCSNVMYMQADDHYTQVFYLSGAHFMVPFGLSVVADTIQKSIPTECFLKRVGRKYIINLRKVFHINTVKQYVMLTDNHGNNHSLHLPKQILKDLIELIDGFSEYHGQEVEQMPWIVKRLDGSRKKLYVSRRADSQSTFLL